MQDEYIDLTRVLEIIKKKLFLFIVIILVCATGMFGYAKLGMEKTYTATATVIIVQQNNNMSNSSVTMSDVQLSQKLVNTYKQIIMSEAIGDEVIKNLNLENTLNNNFKEIVKASPVNETEIMNISATTNDPKLSAKIANETVEVLQYKIYDIMQIENISILNNAKIPTIPSGPNIMKNVLFGFMFGILICLIIILKEFLTDTKIKSEEEIKEIFDYPIIGVIPEFDMPGGDLDDK